MSARRYHDLVVDPRNLRWMRHDGGVGSEEGDEVADERERNLVSLDITHCLQRPSQRQADGSVRAGGYRELTPWMGRVGMALGVDGLFMEVR